MPDTRLALLGADAIGELDRLETMPREAPVGTHVAWRNRVSILSGGRVDV